MLLPVSFHRCFIVIFGSSAIYPTLTSRRTGSGRAWGLNSWMEINFDFQWKWAENITINKRRFAVISSCREWRTLCNICKNCCPLILKGPILQDTFSWSRNCRFYEIPSSVATFAEAIHWVVPIHLDPVSTVAPYSSAVFWIPWNVHIN